MIVIKLAAAGALALAIALPSSASANLLSNGSFEAGTFVGDSRDTDTLAVGSTAIQGWTVAGSHSLAWIGPSNPFGLTASDGSYFLDLTGDFTGAPFSGVTQTIATTAGSTYRLTFDLGSSSTYGLPDGLTASAGSASQTFVSTATGTNDYAAESLTFTATGASTTVSLIGAQGGDYIGLDNVSVSFVSGAPVPEPAGLLVMAAGLLGLGLLGRRANG